jgi:hypothetical protein
MRRLATIIFGLAACSAPTPAGDDLASTSLLQDLAQSAGNGDLPSGDLASVYPAPPYGNNVGDVFPLLQWEGYVDLAAGAVANTKPFVSYSTDTARLSGHKFALIHVSDFF